MACAMDDFWSLDFWNNPVPIFSNCFKTAVSAMIPSVIFFLLAVYDIFSHTERRNKLNPRTFLLLARIVISVILIFLSVGSFLPSLFQGSMEISFHDPRFVGHFLKMFTNIAALCLLIRHINFGQTYSNSLSVYWILQSIAVLPFHAALAVEEYYQVSWRTPMLEFVLEMVYYPLIYMQFVLSIFTSKHPYTPQRRSPMEEETMILFLTFHWLYKLIWRCKRKALLVSNLFPLPLSLGVTYIRTKVGKHLRGKRSGRSAYEMVNGTVKRTPEFKNFSASLLKAFSWRLSCCLCLETIDSILQFVPSFILGWIIDHLSRPSRTWNGYLLCSLLVFAVFTCRCVGNLLMLQSNLYVLQIKAALMDAVYVKALKMSCSARRQYSSGELANLLSADVERVEKLATEVIIILGAPLKICLAIGLMWYFLGSAWIAALVIIIIVIIASLVIGKRISKLQVEQMTIKDDRLKIITEIINCVKVIKLYAWENPFVELVNEIRKKEVLFIRKQLLYYAGSSFIWGWAPFLIVCSCLLVFITGQPNGLSISLVFVTIDVVNHLRYPLFSVSEITSVVAQAYASLKRLNRFFASEEYDTDAIGSLPDDGHAITIKNARLTWDKPTEVLLQNIHMNIPKGSLVAIIGTVGSGKSSLLSSILGDMKILSGSIDYE
ncbi:multidrug resistance-associated protein 1-like, partial [Stegodyphus dumicola]|uniref:multidrug resistance-associated protein 1-like n=1 Tax=Stegodyphus dumicola TaxID=202533 RepID=UPI0015B27780